MKQTDLFDVLEPDSSKKATAAEVIAQITGNCKQCRLGQTTDRNNNGVYYMGSTLAKVAFLGDMPDIDATMLTVRQPIGGDAWWTFKEWLAALGMAEEDVFLINTVQCKTTKGRAKDAEERQPFPEEIDACFPFRALRVLRAMPNLEVVVTLGWTSAGALVGRVPEPKQKSHEGQWFGTDLLPGVAIFCLDHPREFGRDAEPRRLGRLQQYLEFFQSEYLRKDTCKILEILRLRSAERAKIKAE